ncbi:hypothetical protein EOS93_10255 [Rhizobium sp. RMa-01]|nr:hypothetical protein EOS93_10255 [Rhizobium sp. RMa-01]
MASPITPMRSRSGNADRHARIATADYTGVDIDYPELIALSEDELGSLRRRRRRTRCSRAAAALPG